VGVAGRASGEGVMRRRALGSSSSPARWPRGKEWPVMWIRRRACRARCTQVKWGVSRRARARPIFPDWAADLSAGTSGRAEADKPRETVLAVCSVPQNRRGGSGGGGPGRRRRCWCPSGEAAQEVVRTGSLGLLQRRSKVVCGPSSEFMMGS
jgi:hypothetical protein